jgi:6,7-dimethyl-8-ribityllumazine synthase
MVKKMKQSKGTRKKTNFKENAGTVFVNLGQIVFGTVCLGGVLRGEIPHYIMIIAGAIVTILSVLFGLLLCNKTIKEE